MTDVCSQIEEMEAQMSEMQQSRAVLAETETSLRQQVSSLQVSCPLTGAPMQITRDTGLHMAVQKPLFETSGH